MPEMDGYETIQAHPQHAPARRPADHRAHRQGHAGRPREGASRAAPTTTSPSRWTWTSCCRSIYDLLDPQGDASREPASRMPRPTGDDTGTRRRAPGNRATTTSPRRTGRRRTAPTSAGVRRPSSILIVDDMEENLVALEAVLGPLGQRVVRAHSGEEALKAMLRQEFAVVLLDVLMPGMDGFETAANIKRLDQTKDVPIILLTGTDVDPNYAYRGYAVGAADFLDQARSTPGCCAPRSTSSSTCTARTANSPPRPSSCAAC